MNENLQELQEVACLPTTILLNGEPYDLVPLSPGDLIRSVEHLRKLRMDRCMANTRSIPLNELTMSKVISEMVTQTVTVSDVVLDREASVFLIYQSLNKAGKKLDLKQVKEKLDPVDNNVWLPTLLKISKLTIPDADTDGESPLSDTTSSQKP